MTPDVDHWLATLGLPEYGGLFRANHIDGALLLQLSADDLKEIGVASLGHRKRILEAIAGSAAAAPSAEPGSPLPGRERSRQPNSYTPRHLADKILQSRSALEGERKQVSVLFADVTGSMALAEQLDPEQWHLILEGFFAILTEGVHRFEGTVNQYTGDGIMALFGAPIAHEDHAQRACFAALHVQREIARYATEVKRAHGVGFSTRMGINSGEVVVGRIGDDLRMDYTAQGHTVGLAQRMEGLAEPNTCYLSAATAAFCAGYFALEDLGEFQVKGVAGPVAVHKLAGIGAARNRFDISRQRGLSAFVGRATDLRALDDALEQAAAGNGQVVGVVAQAGTGKSRLCFEFLERCRARGLRVLEGRAVAHGSNVPLLPVLEIFRAVFEISALDDSRRAREKIAGRVVMLDASLADALPLLFDFLGVGDRQRPAPDLEPAARRRQLADLLVRLTQGVGGVQPTVTMVEDLHWLDAASAEFVDHLVRACAGQRSLLLLNFRPEFQAAWMQQAWYRSIALAPLGLEAMADLMAGLLGRDATIAALAVDVHARTGGNPFFAEEVAQSLIESGQLAGEPGAYRLVTPIARLEVPPTVQAVLAARIDRLPEREKHLLQVASVVGKDFSEPLLAAVAELDPPDLIAALGVLCRAEFIHEVAIYPVAQYAFKHPLTQEVALGGQLRERRRGLHAAVARAIEQQAGQRLDELAALLAHHWDEAGDVRNAAQWHQRAALWPGCPDFASVIHHWERVRVLLRALPDERAAIDLRILACTRLLTLGQRVGAGLDASQELLREAEGLANAIGDRRAQVGLAMAYGWVLANAGEIASCIDALDAMEPVLHEIGDPMLDAAAWGNRFVLTGLSARFPEALRMLEQGRGPHGANGPAGRGIGSYNAVASIAGFQGYCLAWSGRTDEAFDAWRECMRLADTIGELAVFARSNWSEACYHLRDPAGALERALQAEQICHKLGDPPMLATRVQLAFAHAHLAAGRARDAVAAARAAQEKGQRVDGGSAGLSAVLLAQGLLMAGEFDAALEAAGEAIALCRHSLRANYEAVAHGVVARALLRRDGASACAAAQGALDAVAALVERTGARLLAPALAEWRAELAGVMGDGLRRQAWLDDAARGYAGMLAPEHVAPAAA
jgi:adenylate cyclase